MAGLLEQFSKGLFGLAPTPAPNGVFGQVLDSAAQWGRGVQDKAANIQTTLADLLRNPSNALPNIPPQTLANLLQQPVTPEQKQNIASKALDFGMEFGPLATVWHGSPHLFNKFDMSKIGTGEGAQAYGHGLYFAENPATARYYADALAVDHRDAINKVIQALPSKPSADDVFFEMQRHPALKDYLNSSQVKNDIISAKSGAEAGGTVSLDAIGAYKRLDKLLPPPQKSVYKVDLPDEHIAKMLDWDKPLSKETPQQMKDAFNSIIAKYPEIKDSFMQAYREQKPGHHYYSLLNDFAKTGDLVKNQTFATNVLKEAGIPGIRYLDGGSRAGGKGTSNFVVFDDAIPKIIGRE